MDAVALPLNIKFATKASGAKAVLGISNNPAPLPLKIEPDVNVTLPLMSIEPVNSEPLAADSTLNPNCGVTDAVTEPVAICVVTKTSSANADNGILNNPAPSPLNNDADTEPDILTLPVNWEPLAVFTKNLWPSLTDAVAEPLAILGATVDGTLINWEPSPTKNCATTLPLTSTEPLNSLPLCVDSTLNPKSGDTEAVTEPLAINADNNASGERAALGISNKPAPLPLKIEPDSNVTLPLISIEPVNSEPLSSDTTTNPLSGVTDAVTEPVAIEVATKASGAKAVLGISNNLAPLPE